MYRVIDLVKAHNHTIAVSIPAYNDEGTLQLLVEQVIEVCTKLQVPFSVFIVNDGSADATAAIANTLANRYPFVKVLHHEKNLGFGPALKKVFTVPQADWILFVPGDNQFPAVNIRYLLESPAGYDLIYGYRSIRNDNRFRKMYSLVYNLVISLLGFTRVKDVNSILLISKNALRPLQLKSKSAFIHAELFLKALSNGCRFNEVPITHASRKFGHAGGAKFPVIMSTLVETGKYIINYHGFRNG